MQIIRDAEALRTLIAGHRRDGRRIAFVPTMGNLHAGHHSLVRIAHEHGDVVVASVFVNPTQFGPNEDFARYPRTPQEDADGLARHGCGILFLPGVHTMYPFGTHDGVRIGVGSLGDVLEGASRPGHFDGVATVVAKLFHRVQPDVAVFGRKDYQQLLVIRRMVEDLAMPVTLVGAPIVREANGLAMSSRNQYLGDAQRAQAGAIHATLLWMVAQVQTSDLPVPAIQDRACERLVAAGLDPDYAQLRRADSLLEPSAGQRTGLVALIAARLGSVRLIDNLEIAGPG